MNTDDVCISLLFSASTVGLSHTKNLSFDPVPMNYLHGELRIWDACQADKKNDGGKQMLWFFWQLAKFSSS